MDKYNVVYLQQGILLCRNKEGSTDTCYDMDELGKRDVKWKTPDNKVTYCVI